jgi:S-adenosyl methyltransferase
VESLPDWAPEDVDLNTPSAARMYDYYLGGAHNFGVDRELARQVLDLYPDGQRIAQSNRAFLHRSVRYLVAQGVRQFIDIGSGIPTEGNTHETAQQVAPESRVLYVDHDPVAVAHSELLLSGVPGTGVLRADLRRPQDIVKSAELGSLIDLSEPVGLMMVAVLHFVSEDDDPVGAIAQFHAAVAPGSYLVISHGSDEVRQAEAQRAKELYESANDKGTFRSRARLRELFEGWELVDPGVVWVPQWRPDWPDEDGASSSSVLAVGVGRKSETPKESA